MCAVSYTRADYMSGAPLPKSKIKKRIYGIGLTFNNEISTFIVKNNKTISKKFIEVYEKYEVELSIEDIKILRKELYIKYKDLSEIKKKEKEFYNFRIGKIAVHTDGDAIHLAVIGMIVYWHKSYW